MNRFLILAPALLFAFPAVAQDVPPDTYKDLWCGIAFGIASANVPNASAEDLTAARAAGDKATADQQSMIAQDDMIQQLKTGGEGLVTKATDAYKALGFTDETFGTTQTDLTTKITGQISGTDAANPAEFSFDDCMALLPPPAGAPAATDAPATDAPAADAPATTTTK